MRERRVQRSVLLPTDWFCQFCVRRFSPVKRRNILSYWSVLATIYQSASCTPQNMWPPCACMLAVTRGRIELRWRDATTSLDVRHGDTVCTARLYHAAICYQTLPDRLTLYLSLGLFQYAARLFTSMNQFRNLKGWLKRIWTIQSNYVTNEFRQNQDHLPPSVRSPPVLRQ